MRYREFITTNIRLPKDYLKALKQEALRKEKSVSFLLRELVKEHFRPQIMDKEIKGRTRSIWDFPKLAKKTGNPRLASTVDEIVYGGK